MNLEQLRTAQRALKEKYTKAPSSARVTLRASGEVDFANIACDVPSHTGLVKAGLHPAAGGDGSHACSGDMLLQALVACSGTTFSAVALAMGLQIRTAQLSATGVMDFRGTLAVDRSAPVGITSLSLDYLIDSSEPDGKIEKLIELTERYCVVLKTLSGPPRIETVWKRPPQTS